jgi:hypothetical protein
MTVGNDSARTKLTLIILALVPLLLAITINFPAKAGTPEKSDVGQLEVVAPVAEGPDAEFEVVVDTGSIVVGYESRISAIAITATPDD